MYVLDVYSFVEFFFFVLRFIYLYYVLVFGFYFFFEDRFYFNIR